MKIGIDLDGVVFDSEKELRVYSELFDMCDLHRNSKQNNKELMFQERFNWSQEENEYVKTLYNWGEIYRYIKEIYG